MKSFENQDLQLSKDEIKLIPLFLKGIKKYNINYPISSKKIEAGLKIKGTKVRAIVRYLRRQGYPIGSNERGYFYARNHFEMEETITHIEQRIKSMQETLKEMKQFKFDYHKEI
jgi:biotin operon repressor